MIEETNLYRNTKKTGAMLFSAAAVSLLLVAVVVYSIGIFDGVVKLKPAIFSGAALLVMLYLTFNSLMGMKDKSAMMSFDTTGFLGKTTPLSKAFGRVEWNDVTNIQLQKSGGDTLVVVTVTNIEKYNGRLSKMLWKMAYDEQAQILTLMYSASEIDIDAKELFNLFVSFWKSSESQNT
jgi:hypothetical protein